MTSIALAGCHIFDFLDHGSTNTPRIVWRVSGRAIGAPATDGHLVFFNTGDHHVVALDAATGAERWRAATGSVEGPPPSPSCAIVAELVVCGDEDIVAFHRDDGSVAWRYHATQGYGPGHFAIAVHDGVVFAGSNSTGPLGTGRVYAIDGQSGVPVWIAAPLADDAKGVNILGLSVDNDIVVGSIVRNTHPFTGGVVGLDTKTGTTRWITNFPQAAADSESASTNTALWEGSVLGASTDGRIYLLDRATGAVQFGFPGVGRRAPLVGLTTPVGSDLRAIVVSGSTLYATSTGDWFIAYDLPKRRELWRVVAPHSTPTGMPIVRDEDVVYAVHIGGDVAAYSATGPSVLWDFGNLNDALVGSVAVSPERIFASGITGFWAIAKR